MSNSCYNRYSTQFLITLGSCKWLDGKNVAFGK